MKFDDKDVFKCIYQCHSLTWVELGGVSTLEKNQWGPNVEEFQRRFDPELTNGEGPQRLRNLYFLYLLELRALAKAAPFLEQLDFYTGNASEDSEVYTAVHDLLRHVKCVLPPSSIYSLLSCFIVIVILCLLVFSNQHRVNFFFFILFFF